MVELLVETPPPFSPVLRSVEVSFLITDERCDLQDAKTVVPSGPSST